MADPFFGELVRSGHIVPSAIYLVGTDPASFARYRDHSIGHFGARNVRVLRGVAPYVIEIKSQTDFFNTTGFGIASETDPPL